ncbi:hypothetical protein ES702_03761 [subsurface metagenome]
MNKLKGKAVTLRSKGNKKDITREPEMKELKRMIREGELDQERTLEHLKQEFENGSVLPLKK